MDVFPLAQSFPDPILFAAKLPILVGVLGLIGCVIGARCGFLMERWAAHNGWQIVGRRRRILRTGPFPFMPGQPVYRVELKNCAGQQRAAYIRCGHVLTSVLSDDLVVEWADRDRR